MNHWLIILEGLREGKSPRYYNGLTPRFIIGACQIPIGKKFETKEEAYEATKQMFEEMQEFENNGKIVTSTICDNHKGPVMQLTESNRYNAAKNIGTSFEKIWRRYGEEIVNGTYHIDSEEKKILEPLFV